MEIKIKRIELGADFTIGELSIDGKFLCWTMEDKVREPSGSAAYQPELDLSSWVKSWKVPSATAIPRGRYELDITWSNRFGLLLPILKDVPGFSGIRIHPGNSSRDTEGCILLGLEKGKGVIFKSRLAQGLFIKAISTEIKYTIKLKEKTWVEIS
jgi:hypothetical protein